MFCQKALTCGKRVHTEILHLHREKRKLEEMFSALKNENDKLKSWRLSHASHDMDVSGRSVGAGGFALHATTARSLTYTGAAANPSHLMQNPMKPVSSSFNQQIPPALACQMSERHFSTGNSLGGRPSSAFGLRGSQQATPNAGGSFPGQQLMSVAHAQDQRAHSGSQGYSREFERSQPVVQRGKGTGAGKLSSSVLSLGRAKHQSPATSNEQLFGRQRR